MTDKEMTNEEEFRLLWKELSKSEVYIIPDKFSTKVKLAKKLGVYNDLPTSCTAVKSCPACKEAISRATIATGMTAFAVMYYDNSLCKYCPIEWTVQKNFFRNLWAIITREYIPTAHCEDYGTLYNKWRNSRTITDTCKYANKISKLRWRKK